jgi:hypothetical protein
LTGLWATHSVITRRLGPDHDFGEHNTSVSIFFGACVGLYGITLGLISVGAWQNFSDVDTKAGSEAACLAAIYRDFSSYPEPARTSLRSSTTEYTRKVIEEDWPQQRHGIVPTASTQVANALQNVLYSFEPTTQGQMALHQEALGQYNRLIEHRRHRLQTINSGLPSAIWAVVLLGACCSLAITWLFVMRSKKLHQGLVSLYAALLGLLIFLMGAMDNPYRGEFSIGPDAYQQVYESLMGGRH